MRLEKNPGTAVALLIAGHPAQGALLAAGAALAAMLSGRTLREVALVFAVVVIGRLTYGWLNDVADRERDAAVTRSDKPVAQGWVDPGTVTFTVACATCLLVPLSVANGTSAGIAHLLSVGAAWLGNTRIKLTAWSWLPWAVSFGLLPAFLSYGGWGGGYHGGPPTWTVTVLAALLGVGVHVVSSLTDLVGDHQNGVGSLPMKIALRTGAARLLMISGTFTALTLAALVVAGLTVGLRQ